MPVYFSYVYLSLSCELVNKLENAYNRSGGGFKVKGYVFTDKNKVKWGGFACIVVLLIIGIAVLPSLKKNAKNNIASVRNGVVVDTYVVQRKDLVRKVSLVGQTVAEAQIDIAPKYAGRVTQVAAALGDRVSAGQVLVVEDTGDVEIALAQNRAAYRQAAADVTQTQVSYEADYQKASADYQRTLANYNRYKELYDIGAISREQLDSVQQTMINAKSTYDALENQAMADTTPAVIEGKQAAMAKASSAVDALDKQREDLILRAPRDGMIVYRQVEAGAYVQAGQKIMSLVDNSQLYVECQIAEQDAALLQPGLTVPVQIEALGKKYDAKVIFVSTAKDSGTQTYKVRLALLSPDTLLKSGMFARTTVDVLLRPQTIVVPNGAIQNKYGKYSVYVIDAENKVAERPVELGLSTDAETEIISGIQAGDKVAASNLAKLRPGTVITAAEDDAASSTAVPQS